MSKKYILILLIISNILLLSGCWNYREVERLAIVSGLAVDKDENSGEFLLITELVDVKETMGKTTLTSKKIDSRGKTILDAIRNMIKISGKKLYFSHTKVVIISQDVARENIIPIVDWISRDHEPRIDLDLLISREKAAKELLSQQSVTTDIRALEMSFMLDANKSLSKSPKVGTYEFINALEAEGISPTLPTIGITTIENKETSELSGTAVFKKEKLVGFLDEEESKYLLFIRDKIKGGLLSIDMSENNPKDKVTLEIFKNKTKIKPVYSGENISMNIIIKTEVSIEENDTSINNIDENGRAKLKNESEKYLEKQINNLIKKVQNEFDSDIFGFGAKIKAEMPYLWKTIKDDWDDIFKDLDVVVNAQIDIRNSGITSKPIEVGD